MLPYQPIVDGKHIFRVQNKIYRMSYAVSRESACRALLVSLWGSTCVVKEATYQDCPFCASSMSLQMHHALIDKGEWEGVPEAWYIHNPMNCVMLCSGAHLYFGDMTDFRLAMFDLQCRRYGRAFVIDYLVDAPGKIKQSQWWPEAQPVADLEHFIPPITGLLG